MDRNEIDQERSRLIESLLPETIKKGLKGFGTQTELAKLVNANVEYNLGTVMGFIGGLKSGYGWYRIPKSRTNHSESDRKKLRTLSILLDTIGVREDEEVITRLRTLYHNFIYPPKINSAEQHLLLGDPKEYIMEQLPNLRDEDAKRLGRITHRIISSYEK